MTILFSKHANHQIRYQATQSWLAAWWLHMVTLIFLMSLCGYVWVTILTLSPLRGHFICGYGHNATGQCRCGQCESELDFKNFYFFADRIIVTVRYKCQCAKYVIHEAVNKCHVKEMCCHSIGTECHGGLNQVFKIKWIPCCTPSVLMFTIITSLTVATMWLWVYIYLSLYNKTKPEE